MRRSFGRTFEEVRLGYDVDNGGKDTKKKLLLRSCRHSVAKKLEDVG
jgi:hypothetical protein